MCQINGVDEGRDHTPMMCIFKPFVCSRSGSASCGFEKRKSLQLVTFRRKLFKPYEQAEGLFHQGVYALSASFMRVSVISVIFVVAFVVTVIAVARARLGIPVVENGAKYWRA